MVITLFRVFFLLVPLDSFNPVLFFLPWCQLCPWMHPSNAPNLPDFCRVERRHGVPNTDTGCTQLSPLNVRICFARQHCCRQFLETWTTAARNHPISVMGWKWYFGMNVRAWQSCWRSAQVYQWKDPIKHVSTFSPAALK